MQTIPDTTQGERILPAVERITAPADELLARVEAWRQSVGNDIDAVANAAIRDFSNISGLAGAATAIPAMIPGWGTVATIAVGAIPDLIYTLKTEVELGLCLAAIHGFDIRKPEERQLVFFVSALNLSESMGIRPAALDAMDIAASATWAYAPRRVSKLLVTILAILAVASVGRGLIRAVPVVGILVGAGMNKALTARTGRRMHASLGLRRRRMRDGGQTTIAGA